METQILVKKYRGYAIIKEEDDGMVNFTAYPEKEWEVKETGIFTVMASDLEYIEQYIDEIKAEEKLN